MGSSKQYLEDITEIKSMMERSSRFISLSGLSGIFAGIYALIGAVLVYNRMYTSEGSLYQRVYTNPVGEDISFMIIVAVSVLLLALITGIIFTTRKARQQKLNTWDGTTKRLLINLMIPLAAGGIICIMLLKAQYYTLVAPATLIFYGLALVNASHHTYRDIRYLGLTELVIGLIACIYIGYGLLFWAIGFGVLHIIYGTVMYMRYERTNADNAND
jgi:general stress protein CsbA